MAGFVQAGPRIWPLPPDWGKGFSERLVWGTNVTVANATAVSDHIGWQIGPRRSFSFEVGAFRSAARQLTDMLLAGHSGDWLLPIWPDAQRLAGAIEAGDTFIGGRTVDFDFTGEGHALLWAAPNRWEVLSVDSVDASGLALSSAVLNDWPVGTRLYPLRRAHIQDGAEERLLTDRASRRRLAFDLAEPSDWPMLDALPEYLGHPVLTARPDWSEEPTAAYDRLRQIVEFPGAPRLIYDLPDQALREQSMHWKLVGRPKQSWYRSLLYTLSGRRVPMWLPSFATDLSPAAAVAGDGVTLQVQWAGYTQFGAARHNRRDLRIELADGTVLYRRIIGAAEAGDVETLTLSAALDVGSIAPERIRKVSFMALATLASDTVEIQHTADADGTAASTLGWQAVVPDV
ncbi:MAG: hypothetical protein WA956_05565 [Stenotrophomonas sp.]